MQILLHTVFALFILVKIGVVYVNSASFKHVHYFGDFLELNYNSLNLNFLKLKQLLIDGSIVSNRGPTKNDSESPVGHP